MMGGMMVWWMALWGLVVIAILVAAVFGLVWLVRNASGSVVPRTDGAEEVLRRRYAEGQIDQDEFLSRQAELRRRRAA